MTRQQQLRFVIMPQAVRVMLPPISNRAIGMLKSSSLVSVIGTQELMMQAQTIYSRNYLVIELLIVASIWYLLLTTLANIGQYFLERKFASGGGQFGRRSGRPVRPVEAGLAAAA